MKRLAPAIVALGCVWLACCGGSKADLPEGFVGSASCQSCHEEFYELWAPSHHGLAMQPYTAAFAEKNLPAEPGEVVIGKIRYRIEPDGDHALLVENGPDGERRHQIEHVMGGKNVYYFLTPYERGRLQTLPVAFDVQRQEYFDTAGSGVRHFPDDTEDAALHWTDRAYTFNTSCYSCHVSQLTVNYELEADKYRTTWSEPGINCETCHGPAGEHVRFCEESEEACKEDPRIILTSKFDVPQTNAMCAPCHAKMVAISDDFRPGDRYFDHYDLVTLEHRDFYPDGRDLGENYTYTTWRMSPCVKTGQLDCVHCHTSSGRYRFAADEEANNACMPCHFDKVNNPIVHTHHAEGSEGNKCISCHMPMTEFARMLRSDHSMRPPAPAATIEFESPNACNICHTDRDPEWADKLVREWRSRDYQEPILGAGRLVRDARQEKWDRLDEMLALISEPERDEVFANSIVRLLRNSHDPRVLPALLEAIEDPSPLIRSSAAETLSGWNTEESIAALVAATYDDYRLVRIRAAAALARLPVRSLSAEDRAAVDAATTEFLVSMRTRPDSDASHTNLGNYYMNTGDLAAAISSFETAVKLNDRSVASMVNLALAYNLNGENDKAEQALRQAIEAEPANAAANFNLGLLMGELGRRDEAREALRQAVESDPQMAAAAYNLCVLEAESSLSRAIGYCKQAAKLEPEEPKYGYTLGFYQAQSGRTIDAAQTLEGVINRHPRYMDAYALLARLYQSQGNREAAAAVANRARNVP